MDEDPDNGYKLYGGGSFHKDLFTSYVDAALGDRSLFALKTPSNSGDDPKDWDWFMYLPF